MSPSCSLDQIELEETRLVLRHAAQDLTAKEKFAISVMLAGCGDIEARRKYGLSRQALYNARTRGLRRMRARLEALRIKSISDLLSFTNWAGQ